MRTEELHELYAACYRRLVVQVFALTGDLGEAQDCVQEAFVRVLARPRLLDDVADPEAFLRTVAANHAKSRRRRRALHDRLLRSNRVAEAAPAPPEIGPNHVALVRALRELPAAQREVVALRHIGDLSVAEIAELTRTPVGTVKARLSRGRGRLAELLADEPPAATTRTSAEREEQDHA